MKFSLWTNNGALNSRPIFDAFATSLRDSGYDVSYNDIHSDVHVIPDPGFYVKVEKKPHPLIRKDKKNIVFQLAGDRIKKIIKSQNDRDNFIGDPFPVL